MTRLFWTLLGVLITGAALLPAMESGEVRDAVMTTLLWVLLGVLFTGAAPAPDHRGSQALAQSERETSTRQASGDMRHAVMTKDRLTPAGRAARRRGSVPVIAEAKLAANHNETLLRDTAGRAG